MSQTIEAIYEDGVLKPLEPLNLKEHAKVRIHISAQERESLKDLVREVEEFSKEEVTTDAQTALRELGAGIFESEENLASNHDFFLYGAPKRK